VTFKKLGVVVINDFHPSEQPGAATEALNSAIRIASNGSFRVQFHYGGKISRNFYAEELFCSQIQRLRIQNFLLSKSDRLISARFLKLIIRHLNLCRFMPTIIRNRHSTFVLHSIGTFFPLSMILILNALRVKVCLVHNDFSYLLPGKVYPHHFLEKAKINASLNMSKEFAQLKIEKSSIRRYILRAVCNSMTTQGSLTRLQGDILRANGFQCDNSLVQTVETCRCSEINNSPNLFVKSRIQILFIGRPIGKGFQDLIDLVQSSYSLRLVAVGSNSLSEILTKALPYDKFEFLGRLNPPEIFSAIHNSHVVWARSVYFDVGPLTILEALSHGVPVVCTPITGNAEHARKLMPSLVQPLSFVPDERYIHDVVEKWKSGKRQQKSKKYIDSLPADSYIQMIQSSSTLCT